MIISVIIATYNRAGALQACLDSLTAMELAPGIELEVLVVDNNSSDNTRDVVSAFERERRSGVKYLYEPRQGKSLSLNKALGQSRGDLLAFTDDDCIVDAHWAQTMVREFQADPSLGLLGGRVELYDKRDLPLTILTDLNRFHITSANDAMRRIYGCNMCVRREVVKSVGSFDANLGPGAKGSAICEDIDFVYRTYRAGFGVLYVPDLLVYHNHGRRHHEEIQRANLGYHVGLGAFYCKHVLAGDGAIARIVYWEMRSHVQRLLADRFRGTDAERRRRMVTAELRGAVVAIAAKWRRE